LVANEVLAEAIIRLMTSVANATTKAIANLITAVEAGLKW
jgi:hypothetical protein